MQTLTHHILIIEDDPAVAATLQKGLEQEGYLTTWVNTGASGLACIQEQAPHLILMDVRLPDGSGFDFCRQIRQEGFTQPVLMLTARREELDKVLGLEMGADDYLTKPFSLRELVARIRAMLRRAYGAYAPGEEPDHYLYASDLVFNLDTAQVFRGQKALSLTPTEYRLLVYLARHSGQSLSREQILSAVWNDPYGVEDDRTVNVHIRRLREKVELNPSQPALILTVPGIGYRFVRE